ncbi:MAG: glycosidase [Ignavibacteria bacterium]|jgi:predicted GH43/DUF377 family glycosyl hydrolase|nr:glycosidase [Ignavibacteria bacterium]MCU7503378.1 glycosidase [Ignavibacteria bacterium]MCU7518138.1 glycosidase [Ignavibacteria bacterium]
MEEIVKFTKIKLAPDPSRVLLQPFYPGSEKRLNNVVERIMKLDEKKVEELLEQVLGGFSGRHRNTPEIFRSNFKFAEALLDRPLTPKRKELIGAYLSKEYSVESAALFNPSIVLHPEQGRAEAGSARIIMSLRATGEGHISSIEFREGTVDNGEVLLDPNSKFLDAGELTAQMGEGSYEVSFKGNVPLSERILFPHSPDESHGMEDARFVRFIDGNENPVYYATYTAYDGRKTSIGMIKTNDFRQFSVNRLSGSEVKDKGMALFPKKIGGRYMMISRQDGENLYIMDSDEVYSWNKKSLLKVPVFDWEFVQLGNCGSPIETEAGWLLLIHSVGAVRTYFISAILLDSREPSRVKGYLPEVLIAPGEKTREGYVPNVVYSCGSIIHGGKLIIPFAMADSASGVAVVDVNEMLNRFVRVI